MSITFIGERPNPLIRAGMGPGVIYNRDPDRPLYIGSDSSIVEGNFNSASILDPMSSFYVGGDEDIWVAAPVGTDANNPVPVDFIHSGRSQHYTTPAVLGPYLTTQIEVLHDIHTAVQAITPGGGVPMVQLAPQQVVFDTVPVSGVQQEAGTTTLIAVPQQPQPATAMVVLASASGEMTDIGGIMLEVVWAFDTDTSETITTLQTGYQGGMAALSGMTVPAIPVPAGATECAVNVLITCTTGTWTVSGGASALFQ